MNEIKLQILKMLLSDNDISSQSVETENSTMLNKYVVVRTYSAGVHIGKLIAKSGTNVLLNDAMRLWKWEGAFTLSEVSKNGITGGRVGTPITIELTQAIELIPINETALLTIRKFIKDV